jgi:hypothetical protein
LDAAVRGKARLGRRRRRAELLRDREFLRRFPWIDSPDGFLVLTELAQCVTKAATFDMI